MKTEFQEKIDELLGLPDGLPPKLEPWNDNGDPELYESFVMIDTERFKKLTDGFNFSDLGKAVGMSGGYISNLRRGANRTIPFGTAENIADLIDADVFEMGELVDGLQMERFREYKSLRVLCVELNKVFESAKTAAREMNLKNEACIRYAILHGSSSAGYHWKYRDKEVPIKKPKSRRKEGAVRKGPIGKKVQCVETGLVFESADAAGRYVGLKSGVCIRQCCRGVLETAGGFHWQYA